MSRNVQVWEYKVEELDVRNLRDWKFQDLEVSLKWLGNDGWELIQLVWGEASATSAIGVFKRPKS
jgi:hypothetical protein